MPDPGPVVPPGPAAPPDEPSSLTGIWVANDGGAYFLRQIGDALWWAGLSSGLMHPGLQFCNVFHGTVTDSAVTGEWSDVPRGATSGRGTLTLRPAGGGPPSELTGSRIGDTGAVTFGLGRTKLAGRDVPMLSTGEFRLMKLYDA
jgi:hypothetical protein